jgi:RNA-directed DNA polymerase
MLANIAMDKVILKKWLKAGYIENYVFHTTQEGTPQGGIASLVLARLVLNGLEKMLKEKYPTYPSKGKKAKVNVVVYADDFVVTSGSRELLITEIKPTIENFLKQRGLELSKEKTKITNVKEGFDFLGQNIRKYKGKLLIKPSKKNIKNFLDKIWLVIKANKQAKTENLIGLLNPIIRGWANYHKAVASKSSFAIVDHAIYKMLWRWAQRRHPIKSRNWVMEKYFKSITKEHWVFGVKFKDKDGKEKQLVLYRAASTPIKRHTKIKSDANAYDPQWESYTVNGHKV